MIGIETLFFFVLFLGAIYVGSPIGFIAFLLIKDFVRRNS